jgi:hypothetical protein
VGARVGVGAREFGRFADTQPARLIVTMPASASAISVRVTIKERAFHSGCRFKERQRGACDEQSELRQATRTVYDVPGSLEVPPGLLEVLTAFLVVAAWLPEAAAHVLWLPETAPHALSQLEVEL